MPRRHKAPLSACRLLTLSNLGRRKAAFFLALQITEYVLRSRLLQTAAHKKPRLPAVFQNRILRLAYARPACFMTSEAKSSVCFSMPSPTAMRTKLITSAPADLSICSTLWLVSST